MSEVKWLKLSINVFDDEKFDAIYTLPDSNEIQLVWIKLLCLAGTCNERGYLMLTNEIPYTEEMMASRFRMDIGVVQRALMVFKKLNMIDVVNDVYLISNWAKYQSVDKLEDIKKKDRERKARQRQREKEALQGEQVNLQSELPDKNSVNTDDSDGENSSEVNKNSTSTNCHVTCHGNVTGFCSNTLYSYSFKDNSNIDNIDYLLSNNIYKDTGYLISNTALLESIRDWMVYKDDKDEGKKNKEHHYQEMGMKKLLTEIINMHKLYGDEAVRQAIDHSISSQYKGILWEWIEKRFKPIEKHDCENEQLSFYSDRPERFQTCPEPTWLKLKRYVDSDGNFDWGAYDPSIMNAEDKRWMASVGM